MQFAEKGGTSDKKGLNYFYKDATLPKLLERKKHLERYVFLSKRVLIFTFLLQKFTLEIGDAASTAASVETFGFTTPRSATGPEILSGCTKERFDESVVSAAAIWFTINTVYLLQIRLTLATDTCVSTSA